VVAVAIAAVDFGAIRELLAPGMRPGGDLLLAGGLPMANVLVVGLLIAHQRRRSRPFLLGFEVFGATALAVYIALASGFREEAVIPYLNPFINPLENILKGHAPIVFIPIMISVAVVVLSLPQVVFALIGGLLSRRFKITITPR
jgi:hypothetical protein